MNVFLPDWPMADPLLLSERKKPYKLKGRTIPSVTTILKNLAWSQPGLLHWANKLGLEGRTLEDGRKPEADAGKMAHYFADCFAKQLRPDLTKIPTETEEQRQKKTDCEAKAQTAFLGFYDWAQREKPKWVGTELELIDEAQDFAGTIDALALIRDTLVLVDYKTSKAVYADYIIQVAAYRELLRTHRYDIHQVLILQMNKEDGSFMPHPIVEEKLRHGWEVFKLLKAVHPYKKVLDSWAGRDE